MYLNDYSKLVSEVKKELAKGLNRRQAISNAVKFCVENEIMKDFLEKNSEEVFNMLDLEWNQEIAMQARFDDGRDEGIETVAKNLLNMGIDFEKIQEATKLSLERINQLAQTLAK